MAEPNRRDRQEPINAEQLTGLSTREVMNYLHSFNASLSKAAQDELIRRGFDTYELGAARRLGSPEPEDRQALAEALSALPISPVRWLIWLSLDKDCACPAQRRVADGHVDRSPAYQSTAGNAKHGTGPTCE